jgi:hypothetical protein
LFRRSCHATADGEAANVIGLASAARRGDTGLPDPMLAAILQQEAQGYASMARQPTVSALWT